MELTVTQASLLIQLAQMICITVAALLYWRQIKLHEKRLKEIDRDWLERYNEVVTQRNELRAKLDSLWRDYLNVLPDAED